MAGRKHRGDSREFRDFFFLQQFVSDLLRHLIPVTFNFFKKFFFFFCSFFKATSLCVSQNTCNLSLSTGDSVRL